MLSLLVGLLSSLAAPAFAGNCGSCGGCRRPLGPEGEVRTQGNEANDTTSCSLSNDGGLAANGIEIPASDSLAYCYLQYIGKKMGDPTEPVYAYIDTGIPGEDWDPISWGDVEMNWGTVYEPDTSFLEHIWESHGYDAWWYIGFNASFQPHSYLAAKGGSFTALEDPCDDSVVFYDLDIDRVRPYVSGQVYMYWQERVGEDWPWHAYTTLSGTDDSSWFFVRDYSAGWVDLSSMSEPYRHPVSDPEDLDPVMLDCVSRPDEDGDTEYSYTTWTAESESGRLASVSSNNHDYVFSYDGGTGQLWKVDLYDGTGTTDSDRIARNWLATVSGQVRIYHREAWKGGAKIADEVSYRLLYDDSVLVLEGMLKAEIDPTATAQMLADKKAADPEFDIGAFCPSTNDFSTYGTKEIEYYTSASGGNAAGDVKEIAQNCGSCGEAQTTFTLTESGYIGTDRDRWKMKRWESTRTGTGGTSEEGKETTHYYNTHGQLIHRWEKDYNSSNTLVSEQHWHWEYCEDNNDSGNLKAEYTPEVWNGTFDDDGGDDGVFSYSKKADVGLIKVYEYNANLMLEEELIKKGTGGSEITLVEYEYYDDSDIDRVDLLKTVTRYAGDSTSQDPEVKRAEITKYYYAVDGDDWTRMLPPKTWQRLIFTMARRVTTPRSGLPADRRRPGHM